MFTSVQELISNQEILAIHDISDGGLITSLIEMCFTKRIGMKVDLSKIENINEQLIVDKLNWKGEAKKSGLEMDDIITEIKTENFDRPNKDVVYVFSIILLIIFGYFNYTNYRIRKN